MFPHGYRVPRPISLLLVVLIFSSILTHPYISQAKEDPSVPHKALSILQENCTECHGTEKQKGQFRVDKRASLLKGGDSGEAAVVPGKPEKSFLVKLVQHQESDLKMPPKKPKLSEADLATISDWIQSGAPTPASYGGDIEEVDLSHWSLTPPERPKGNHTIDSLIQDRLRQEGLSHSESAPPHKLIRRLHLVMLGLPPSPEAVDAFIKHTRPDKWARTVDSILESPHYGERFATLWLDLTRFGETHGFETNRERPGAWRYRDWVINSFNADKPYDQFVREQIAGDALGAPQGTAFIVGGPYDVVKGGGDLAIMQRMNELDDMINTTGTAFLGLTLGCARCHNHKFDPVSQVDYYALQAVFAGVKHGQATLEGPERQAALAKAETLEKDLTSKQASLEELRSEAAEIYLKQLQAGENPMRPPVNARTNEEIFKPVQAKRVRMTITRSSTVQPCIDELEIYNSAGENVAREGKPNASGSLKGHAIHQLAHINDGKHGNSHSWICDKPTGWIDIDLATPTEINRIVWGRDKTGKYTDRLSLEYRFEATVDGKSWIPLSSSADRSKEAQTAASDFSLLPEPQKSTAKALQSEVTELEKRIKELKSTGPVAWVGNFTKPGPTYRLYRGEHSQPRERVTPDTISALGTLDLENDSPEQARRVALAKWITDSNNPLTARVIVNRIWQFHFGIGLVNTPSDFGTNGSSPTHPELLDWLAVELMENNWSLKHIHRLILMSSTWRQDSTPQANAIAKDSSSRLLWRFPPRRLEAEGIRDSILAVSGSLDLTMGGPGFSPFEVHMENVRHYHPKKSFGPEDWRRMIYMTKVRQEREAVFGVFDCPDAAQPVPMRGRSTTPLQALNLFNSKFVLQQAEILAKRLQKEAPADLQAQIQRAWQLCYGHAATDSEVTEAVSFIDSEGLIQFCRAILNSNEFLFIP